MLAIIFCTNIKKKLPKMQSKATLAANDAVPGKNLRRNLILSQIGKKLQNDLIFIITNILLK